MADESIPAKDQASSLENETQDEIDKIMGEIEELRQEIGAEDDLAADSAGEAEKIASAADDLFEDGSDGPAADVEPADPLADFNDDDALVSDDELATASASVPEPPAEEIPMEEPVAEDDSLEELAADDDLLEEADDESLEEMEEETVAEVAAAVAGVGSDDLGDDTSVVDEFSTDPEDEPSMDSTLADMPENAPEEGSSLIDQSLSDEPVAAEAASEEPIDDLDSAMTGGDDVAPTPAPSVASVTPLHAGVASAEDSTMTMTLSGKMSLRLRYEDSGHEVEVSLSNEGFVLRFGDGSEFRLPSGPAKRKKESA